MLKKNVAQNQDTWQLYTQMILEVYSNMSYTNIFKVYLLRLKKQPTFSSLFFV